jgi:hypothetical protein
VWGWQVITTQLKALGYHNISVMECNSDVFDSLNFEIRAVPPLNVTGLEAQGENEMSIDAGFRLVHKATKVKLVFLADDNLYSEERVNDNFELLEGADLIAFAYSGFASDYPFKYKMTHEERIKICERNEEYRFNLQLKHLKALRPKCIMPYSSEFAAVGADAINWRKVLPEIWTSNKRGVAEKYSVHLDCEGVALYPGDYVTFNENGDRNYHVLNFSDESPHTVNNLLNYCDSINFFTEELAYPSVDVNEFHKVAQSAVENYKHALKKHGLKPQQNIDIVTRDVDYILSVSREGFIVDNAQVNSGSKLVITGSLGFLFKILTGKLHWDDACLSMHLDWERTPDFFCGDTMNALNYLRI